MKVAWADETDEDANAKALDQSTKGSGVKNTVLLANLLNAQHSSVDSQFTNAQISDWIESAAKLSSWHVLRNEEAVSKAILQLKRALDMIKEYQVKMLDCHVFQKISYLGALEQSLSARPGFAAEFMKLLANVIDDHLSSNQHNSAMRPVRRNISPEELRALSDDLDDAFHCPIAKCEDMILKDFGRFKACYSGQNPDNVAKIKRHEAELATEVIEILKRLREKHHATYCGHLDGQSIIAYLVVETLDIAATQGWYSWLMRAGPQMDLVGGNRNSLQWAEIGPIFTHFIKVGNISEAHGIFPRMYEDTFRNLVTVTIPAFTEQASDLLSVLEYKKTTVATVRAKILAVSVSVAIAGSNLLFAALRQYVDTVEGE